MGYKYYKKVNLQNKKFSNKNKRKSKMASKQIRNVHNLVRWSNQRCNSICLNLNRSRSKYRPWKTDNLKYNSIYCHKYHHYYGRADAFIHKSNAQIYCFGSQIHCRSSFDEEYDCIRGILRE